MWWKSRHHALKIAVGTVVTAMGITAGCERAADTAAMKFVEAGDYRAAAAENKAIPAIAKVANSLAADSTYYPATATYQSLAGTQMEAAGELWRLNTVAIIADQMAASSQYLLKHNPQAAIAAIDTTVNQIQSKDSAAWVAGDTGVEVSTIFASQTQVDQLKDKIAELERQLAALQQKRQQTTQQSIDLMNKSEQAKGAASVDFFRQASELRKQASGLVVRSQDIENQLLPLRQDLAQVQASAEVVAQLPDIMAGHRDMVERSWRGINSQADQRLNAATAVFSRGERTGGVMDHANKVAALLVQQDAQAATYEKQMQEAIGYAKAAVTAAENALRQAGTAGAGGSPAKVLVAAMDPATARFTQAHMELALGSEKGGRAELLASRARTAQSVADVAKRLNQPVPEVLEPQAAATAKQQAAQEAAETLKSAVELYANAAQAGSVPVYTRHAADIGQMTALHASALVAMAQDDAATAKQYMDQAIEIRDRLAIASESLPSLPASMRNGIPAPAVAPAFENTPAPAPTPGAAPTPAPAPGTAPEAGPEATPGTLPGSVENR